MHYQLSLFAFLLLLCVACSEDDDIVVSPKVPSPSMDIDTTLTYLALGDSYTIGTSVPAPERWPTQLSEDLAENRRIGVSQLDYVATNGWRTDNLANGISSASLLDEYDMVSLLIGVNDQFQGFSLASYRTNFTQLLNTAINLAGGQKSRVFVVSIPDYAFTPFGSGDERISRQIDAFNAAAREVTEGEGVPFYNITPISRMGLDDPTLVAGDGLHPSGKQYGRWVEEVILTPVGNRIERGN